MATFKKKKDPFADREAQKYENPIPSREFILEHLAERGRPATYWQLHDELNMKDADQAEALRRRLIAMVRDGQLMRNRRDAYGPLDSMGVIAGRVIGHKDGFGFFAPDNGEEDLFLSPREMRNVFHGDRVLVRVLSEDMRGRREATIVDVLEHNTQQLVGRLRLSSGTAYVESSNKRITQEVLIPPDALKNAENGQMVVVAITAQPSKRGRPIGEIVEVLGDHMAPGMEINVAIRNHDLPYIWPDDAQLEASRFDAFVPEEAIKGRVDFRKVPFVTIDGEDARDFDDAVYCEPKGNGGFKLYVAIADVSAYVRPGSALDKEAYKRGNSVYFPARVIPMLPEELSNGLCSLNPKVDRLVMVCEMTIQSNGRISSYKFSEGVINSHARLTYTQVHAMMEKNDRRMRERFSDVVPHLTHLYDLFHILKASRMARGAIDFDMPETKIVYGKNRKIEKIVPYERFDSHRVIEECMLCANICSARFLEKNEQPALYRVHEGPTEEKLENLKKFLFEIGFKIPTHRDIVPRDYAKVLRAVAERPDAGMIQTILLRSMSQAIYSPDNKGHFGLAYDAYAHFTSPIRRYPDLMVHRAIKQLLTHKVPQTDNTEYVHAGEHCSMTERRADDATNEVKDWLKCEFMMDKVGQTFDGIVSGTTNFGIFVELNDIYVEGLVHISQLPEDYYKYDPIKHALIGERGGRQFRIGDPVKIVVAKVDLDQCSIDFVLEETTKAGGKALRANKGGAPRKASNGKKSSSRKREASRSRDGQLAKDEKKPKRSRSSRSMKASKPKSEVVAPAKKKPKRTRKSKK